MNDKRFTSKQMGDAAEMLVAANLTLSGIPSFIAPVNWPGYDVIAAPEGKRLQKISVKCRGTSPINFRPDEFDWLAVVLIDKSPYQIFIIPKNTARKNSTYNRGLYRLSVQMVRKHFGNYLGNFKLVPRPKKNPQ